MKELVGKLGKRYSRFRIQSVSHPERGKGTKKKIKKDNDKFLFFKTRERRRNGRVFGEHMLNPSLLSRRPQKIQQGELLEPIEVVDDFRRFDHSDGGSRAGGRSFVGVGLSSFEKGVDLVGDGLDVGLESFGREGLTLRGSTGRIAYGTGGSSYLIRKRQRSARCMFRGQEEKEGNKREQRLDAL